MKILKIVGYCILILSILLGTLVDIGKVDINIQIGVFISFSLFLLGIYILCITKDI